MLRHLAVVMLALIGGLGYLRLGLSLAIAVGSVSFVYWLVLPAVLPLWPAMAVVLLAAVLGLVWEHRAAHVRSLRSGPSFPQATSGNR
jgi:hypothetical protein